MPISLDDVRHVATLARLNLSDDELSAIQGDLNALLGQFEDLQRVEVSGLQPKPHAVALTNVLANDVAVPGLTRDQALANCNKTRAGLFIVPTIIEE